MALVEGELEAKKELAQSKWYYYNKFKWKCIANNNYKRFTYLGGGDNELKSATIMKIIEANEENYQTLLKEIYFLACFKRNIYFSEIIDTFLSKKCDKLYIILRLEGVDLKTLIEFNHFNFNEKYQNISRSIIFQVVCGLKFLHKNNLSHNDIKPGNILITSTGKTKICDLGSTDKNSKIRGNGTNGYLSPQAILGMKRTKEDDMYAVGIVFLELLNKKVGLFSTQKDNAGKEQLKNILKNCYDIKVQNSEWNDDNINYNIIISFIIDNRYDQFQYKLKDNMFLNNEAIDNKELIKNLLEIDPSKRKTAEQVLNKKMFKDAKLSFVDSDMDYLEEDYNKFLRGTINIETFKKNVEFIREKFIGRTTLDERELKKPEVEN